MNKTILVLIIGIFIISSANAWWDADYGKRQATFVNSTYALTDATFPLNITYDSDMQNDFSDLRFTINDTIEVELNYWIDPNKTVNGAYAYVWVQGNLTAGNNTFYTYYDNNTAVSTTSSGDNTFIAYDNFDNLSEWSNTTNKIDWTASSNEMHGVRVSNGQGWNNFTSFQGTSGIIHFYMNVDDVATNNAGGIVFNSDGTWTSNHGRALNWETQNNRWGYQDTGESSPYTNATCSPEGTWRELELRWNATAFVFYCDEDLIISAVGRDSITSYDDMFAYWYVEGTGFTADYSSLFIESMPTNVLDFSRPISNFDIEEALIPVYDYEIFIENNTYELEVTYVNISFENVTRPYYDFSNIRFAFYDGSIDSADWINFSLVSENTTNEFWSVPIRTPFVASMINDDFDYIIEWNNNAETVNVTGNITALSRFYIDSYSNTLALENSYTNFTANVTKTTTCPDGKYDPTQYFYGVNRLFNITAQSWSESFSNVTCDDLVTYSSNITTLEDNITVISNWGKSIATYEDLNDCRTFSASLRANMIWEDCSDPDPPAIPECVTTQRRFCTYTFESTLFEQEDTPNITVWTFNISTSPIGMEAFNISFYDETLPTESVANVSMESFFLLIFDNGVTRDFSINTTGDTKFYISPNWSSINLTADFVYQKPLWTTRAYYIYNGTVYNNATQQLKFYTNNLTPTSDIKFIVKNDVDQVVENAYVKILRHYAYDGTYKTIAMGKTDANGEVSIPLIPYTVFYRIIVEKNNTVLYSSEAQQITNSEIVLRASSGVEESLFSRYNKVALSYNFTTTGTNTTFYLTATDSSGLMSSVTLDVNEIGFLSDTNVCNTTESGSAVTVYCTMEDVTDKTYNINAKIEFSDGSLLTVYNDYLSNTTGVMGTDGLFAGFLIVGTLAMAGLWSPQASIMLCIIGLMFSVFAGFILTGLTAIASMVVIGIILIVVMQK